MDMESFSGMLNQIPSPDIIVQGERLADYEVPFGVFSSLDEIYTPLLNLQTYATHSSSFGGNKLALQVVLNHLYSNVTFIKDNSEITKICHQIKTNHNQRIKAYKRYVNPALARFYSLCGFHETPIKSEGSVLTFKGKIKKKKVIDCASGGGIGLRGHAPQDIISDVLNSHDKKEDYWKKLQEKLAQLTGFPSVFPAVSGSNAVEIGLQLALMANKDRTRIIVFKGNYSGSSLISMIGTEEFRLRNAFRPLYFDILYIDPFRPDTRDLLVKEFTSKKVALVWMELFQSHRMMKVFPQLLELMNKHQEEGGYLVGFNENFTGLYKLSMGMTFQKEGVSPDFITISKGLGDGIYPMGVTLVSEEMKEKARSFNPDMVDYLEKLHVNQLGAQISVHALEKLLLPENKIKIMKVSQRLKSGLLDLTRTTPLVDQMTGEGLTYKIEFNHQSKLFRILGRERNFIGRALFIMYMNRVCFKKAGVLINVNKFSPALTITPKQVSEVIGRMKKVLVRRPHRYMNYISFLFFAMKNYNKVKADFRIQRPKQIKLKEIEGVKRSVLFRKIQEKFEMKTSTLRMIHQKGTLEKRAENSCRYLFEYKNKNRELILRIEPPYRELSIKGELDWVNFLVSKRMLVPRPMMSKAGNLSEIIKAGDKQFVVSSSEKIIGRHLNRSGEAMKMGLIQNWGRFVGRMHSLTKEYKLSDPAFKRPEWDEYDFYKNPEQFLPKSDTTILEKWEELKKTLASFIKDQDNYGLIHSDVHSDNFMLLGNNLAFMDFDSSIYCWFVYDIAVAMFYSIPYDERWMERDNFSVDFIRNFMKGYNRENRLDSFWIEQIPNFIKLRMFTLYFLYYYHGLNNEHLNEEFLKCRNLLVQDTPFFKFDYSTVLKEEDGIDA
jgi:acetylornithine/succinyldiaminopimelate/putrescine aminotransferase/Ser/Thr protein kinase RdoA (MazF antagonist)